ncbi:BamA/TamA family outer membrane protein [Candidatus Latescibacterota bacterium]
MRFNSLFLSAFITVNLTLFTFTAHAAREMSRTDNFSVSSSGVTTLRLMDIDKTDLTYKGSQNAETISIRFERIVKTDDEDEFEEMLSELELDISTTDGTVTVRLIHPKIVNRRLFEHIFDKREWKIKLDISGPSNIDMDIDTNFSNIRTTTTTGNMKINADFSDTIIRNHTGPFDGNVSFGSLRCEELDGTFDVSSDFSVVDIGLIHLAGNSSASTSFGEVNIRLPRYTGAVFNINKSFAGVNFDTLGSLTYEGHKGSRRVLEGGGPGINLNADFGSISVRDDREEKRSTVHKTDKGDHILPLTTDSWWKYESDGEILFLNVDNILVEGSKEIATLAFDKNPKSPFESINVYETGEGLYICGSNGSFYGSDLSGVQFEPPRLWLPYNENTVVEGGSLLGTVRVQTLEYSLETPAGQMSNVKKYTIEAPDNSTNIIHIAQGVGFVAFNDFKLTSYDTGISSVETQEKLTPEPPPEPRFEMGVVNSITINIRRPHLISEADVKNILDISEGETHSRSEISEAVDALSTKHRFIDHAYYSIDMDGNLAVRVYEVETLTKDFDIDASFSRVAGIGLGPKLTVTSLVGPISELSGSAQYHWGNEKWTYNILAEKRILESPHKLAVGGTYRLDYESGLDWAIPPVDSYLNAFILGLETKNYYQVEGATAYLSFIFGNLAGIQAEYFEEEFSTIKKHTNWSFFNHRHHKDDNPPLAPLEEGTAAGMRYRFEIAKGTSIVNSSLTLEAEQAFDWGPSTLGEYTRLLGNTVFNWRLTPGDLLKLRVAGGYSKDALPGQKAFRLGGLNTLRGFDYESIPTIYPLGFMHGGNRMVLTNIEYFIGHDRNDLGLVLFADAGGVWVKNQDFDVSDIRRDLGIGLIIDGDFFSFEDTVSMLSREKKRHTEGFRINWAVPVGNEKHVSKWTVNFVRAF